MHNLTRHFLEKRQVRIERNFLKRLSIHQRLSLEKHKEMNQTLKNRLMAALTSKLVVRDFFWSVLNSQRVRVANFMAVGVI